MLEYDRIEIFEGIDTKKTSFSSWSMIELMSLRYYIVIKPLAHMNGKFATTGAFLKLMFHIIHLYVRITMI